MGCRTNRQGTILTIALVCSSLGAACGRQGDINATQSGSVRKGNGVLPEAVISARVLSNDIVVELTLVNHDPEPFSLLKWNLPENGKLTTTLFQVQRNGQAVEYKGLMMKRKVTAADFISLKPGQAYTASVGLAQGYEVGAKGRYSVQYKAWNQTPDGKRVDSIASNVVEVEK